MLAMKEKVTRISFLASWSAKIESAMFSLETLTLLRAVSLFFLAFYEKKSSIIHFMMLQKNKNEEKKNFRQEAKSNCQVPKTSMLYGFDPVMLVNMCTKSLLSKPL